MASDDVNRGLPSGIDPARIAARARAVARKQAEATSRDAAGQGTGAPSRLPPGQKAVRKWPRLDLGVLPEVDLVGHTVRIDGLCRQPLQLDLAAIAALPQHASLQDFHCVTGWSRLDLQFSGVRVRDVLELAGAADDARFLLVRGADGYSANLPREQVERDDVLLVTHWDGAPLPIEHGGPIRMVTPQLWAWKGVKWVTRIELRRTDRRGFWERRGYSNTADPFRDDRFDGGVAPETYAVEVPDDAEPYQPEET